MMSSLVVTGASGFIGRHFLSALGNHGAEIRALTRGSVAAAPMAGVVWTTGDLADPSVWSRLLAPGCVVVNLAYPRTGASADVLTATRTMVESCARLGAARLVHCSTISVYGRTAGGVIDETTSCNPIDDYGRRKLAIEETLMAADAGSCEVTILRPAAVFGAGGRALRTLATSLRGGASLTNYLRASLFGQRAMHLVPVETVVAALQFLATTAVSVDREIFIVAEDDDPLNNFRDVERELRLALHQSEFSTPILSLPAGVLRVLLRLRGRGEIDPYCRYNATKLHAWGFVRPITFCDALTAQAKRLAAGEGA